MVKRCLLSVTVLAIVGCSNQSPLTGPSPRSSNQPGSVAPAPLVRVDRSSPVPGFDVRGVYAGALGEALDLHLANGSLLIGVPATRTAGMDTSTRRIFRAVADKSAPKLLISGADIASWSVGAQGGILTRFLQPVNSPKCQDANDCYTWKLVLRAQASTDTRLIATAPSPASEFQAPVPAGGAAFAWAQPVGNGDWSLETYDAAHNDLRGLLTFSGRPEQVSVDGNRVCLDAGHGATRHLVTVDRRTGSVTNWNLADAHYPVCGFGRVAFLAQSPASAVQVRVAVNRAASVPVFQSTDIYSVRWLRSDALIASTVDGLVLVEERSGRWKSRLIVGKHFIPAGLDAADGDLCFATVDPSGETVWWLRLHDDP